MLPAVLRERRAAHVAAVRRGGGRRARRGAQAHLVSGPDAVTEPGLPLSLAAGGSTSPPPPGKSPQVRRLVESAGATPLLLPPYSPDFNPVEMAISKAKAVLRKLTRRTLDTLYDGIAEALAAVTAGEARNFITDCGYGLR